MQTIDRVHADLDALATTNVGIVEVVDCMSCGFRVSDARPSAALALLRTIPARYRDLFLGAGAPDEIDGMLHDRLGPTAWSAIEYGAHVAELLHSTSKRLLLIFDEGDRELSPPHLEAVTASARTASHRAVLASLFAGADDLARVIGGAEPDAWDREARRTGRRVTARQLLGEAEHEALHHLYDARGVLQFAREHRSHAAS